MSNVTKEHKKLYKAGKNWVVATLTATTITLLGGIGAYTVHADTTIENTQSIQAEGSNQSSQNNNSNNSVVVLNQPVTTQSNSTVKNSQPVQNTPTTLTVTAATNTLDNQGQQIESQNSANENIGSAVSLTETSTDNLSNNDNSSLWYHPDTTGFEYDVERSGTGDRLDRSIQDPYQPSITVYYSFADFSENPAISQYAHKSVTRTIYLQNPQTGVESVGGQAQVNFNRWIAIDSDYDNQLVGAGPWIRSLESSASLPQYNIPQINGYTSYCNGVKTERIKAENNVIGDQPDEIYHITYKPNVESVTRTIIITKPDGDSSSAIQNVEMGSSDYIWPEYLIPQYDGYDSYVDNQKTTNIPAQIAGSNSVTVNVTYQEKSGNPTTNEQHKTITRTIDIYELNGHIDIVTQSVSFTRSVLNDKDDETSYSNWTADGNSYWDEYIIPQHAGYKSQCNLQDTRIIPRQYVNSNDQSTILSVFYVKSNNNSGIDNNINVNDHGNYAFLDNESIDTNGQLNVSGWHATNASYGRPYHYIILLDHSSGTEIKRINITNQELQREDVANVHPVYGANHSGFNVRFNLASILPNLSQVQVVSRYTNDPSGNGDSVDYWFNPISIDRSNRAWMDNVTINNNQLVVSGWHATNLSANKPYHVLIAFDRTLNHEIARVNVKQINRPDVANIYPDIYGADKSGFLATFNLHPEFTTDSIQFVSRYSSDPDCNSDYIDYWFNPQRLINDSSNNACLDNVSIQGDSLHISGWHATNQSIGRPYHYIIAWDRNLGHEIARQRVTAVSRPDVAKAYSTVANAVNSGFSVKFNLTPQFFNDNIQFISRWTDDAAGNGNAVDYWFKPMNRTNRANLDSVTLSNGQVRVAGWHATDLSQLEPNHYLIVFDNTTGQQVASEKVDLQSSQDVKNVFGDIQTADHSRFNYTFNSLHLIPGHNYSLVSRYSADANGNGNDGAHTDSWLNMGTFQQSAYSIDHVALNRRHMTVQGWVANDNAMTRPYAYAILLQNGHEIGRQRLNLSERADVAKVYPQIYRSQYSGFNTSFDLPTASTNGLQLVLRFTDDPAGNGNSSDKWINL